MRRCFLPDIVFREVASENRGEGIPVLRKCIGKRLHCIVNPAMNVSIAVRCIFSGGCASRQGVLAYRLGIVIIRRLLHRDLAFDSQLHRHRHLPKGAFPREPLTHQLQRFLVKTRLEMRVDFGVRARCVLLAQVIQNRLKDEPPFVEIGVDCIQRLLDDNLVFLGVDEFGIDAVEEIGVVTECGLNHLARRDFVVE